MGTDIEISVEVKAASPEGFPDHVTRTAWPVKKSTKKAAAKKVVKKAVKRR